MKKKLLFGLTFCSIIFTNLSWASPCDNIINHFYNALGYNTKVTVKSVKYNYGGGRYIKSGDSIEYSEYSNSKMFSVSGSHGDVQLELELVLGEYNYSGSVLNEDNLTIILTGKKAYNFGLREICKLSYGISKPLIMNKRIHVNVKNDRATNSGDRGEFEVIFGG